MHVLTSNQINTSYYRLFSVSNLNMLSRIDIKIVVKFHRHYNYCHTFELVITLEKMSSPLRIILGWFRNTFKYKKFGCTLLSVQCTHIKTYRSKSDNKELDYRFHMLQLYFCVALCMCYVSFIYNLIDKLIDKLVY